MKTNLRPSQLNKNSKPAKNRQKNNNPNKKQPTDKFPRIIIPINNFQKKRNITLKLILNIINKIYYLDR